MQKPPQITGAVERITTIQAARILQARPHNRHISKETVAKYAREMIAGTFQSLNGETIIFNREGGLENGQHRLTARVTSGLLHMDFMVVRGVEPGAYETHDQGRPRSAADAATLRGYQHSRVLMAAVRWLWIYNKEWPGGLTHKVPLSNGELLAYLEANQELSIAEDDVRRNYPNAGVMLVASIAVFVRVVTDALSPEMSKAFFATLQTGEAPPTLRPVLRLRDKLLARQSKTHRLRTAEILILTARVWNAVRKGRDLQKLTVVRDHHGGEGDKHPFHNAPRFE